MDPAPKTLKPRNAPKLDDSMWENRPCHCHLPCHKHVVPMGRREVRVLLHCGEWQVGRRGCTYAAFVVLEGGKYKDESILLTRADIANLIATND
ncbi:hypothetical protein LINGRAPRIM_LOCUS180, partial [Linum grandiflorum]